MFCYGDSCEGNHDECVKVVNLNHLCLDFKSFTSVEEIEMSREILCLVSSYEEPPYFIVLKRYERGICNDFNGEPLKNTRIIKWTYLPHYED